MSTLGVKDTQRLEVVRLYQASDPLFHDVDNRPLCDIEQRTKDLDRIFTPARGLRVRQEFPASADVEVEAGIVVTSGTTILQFAGQTLAIPATGSAGLNRIDLIYYNATTNLAARAAGAEQAVAFSSLARPSLPTDEAIPLAYVYVDNTPTPFDETIVINNAGHIQDVRPAIGGLRRFETNVSNILSDVAGGSLGTLPTVARANHRHPPNVNSSNAQQLTLTQAAAPGTSSIYSRVDHIHNLLRETNPANLQPDSAAGSLGTSGAMVGADHSHPINVPTSGTPTTITPASVATHGTANTYSRSNHQHIITGFMVGRVLFGEVDISGNISIAGSGGWTSVRLSLGNYRVTFTAAFTNTPIVALTPIKAAPANAAGIQLIQVSTSSFDVFTHPASNVAIDHAFHFIAVALS